MDNTPTVLVGYVAGPSGEAALRAAAAEATLRHTSVTMVHKLVGAETLEVYGHVDNARGKRRAAEYHLRRAALDHMPGIREVDVRIVSGSLAEELVIASGSADLIVLGVTTNHPIAAAAFDTVPREISRRALCPVLLTPAGALVRVDDRIVCGIDRSSSSIDALAWAADEAALRGVVVHAVQVRTQHPGQKPIDLDEPLTDWVQHHLPQSATTITCSVDTGSPAARLLDVAAAECSLLVIGGHERSGLWTRSVARVVTSQTRVPVVVVPRPAAQRQNARATARDRLHSLGR